MGRLIDVDIRCFLQKILMWIFPQLKILKINDFDFLKLKSSKTNVTLGTCVGLNPIYKLDNVIIGDYSYICQNAVVMNTIIGKYCSIGPNFLSGWGIHPTNGISISPMFYSSDAENSISIKTKVLEHKSIQIGNDVFIGANVTVLDGVSIGNGAVIGAGAVVSKDIPAYAIAVGCPIRILRYRFEERIIEKLNHIEWWNFNRDELQDVEKMFFDVDDFISKYDK